MNSKTLCGRQNDAYPHPASPNHLNLPWQKELFGNQKNIEEEAQKLMDKKNGRKEAIAKLTEYSNQWGQKVVDKAWKLGDFLWTKYDEKF